MTADGLRGVCTYVSPEEAKPGDLIFFQGTYNTSGASHVGIYVGNNMMIHCGDPIHYSNISTSYWQQKIKKYLDEIAKTEKKIADLQQYLRGVQAALKQEEDNEMIRCIRGMKMDNDQLYDLLDGIQSGKVKFQVSRESNDEGSGSFVFTEENKEEYQNGEMEENE